jgi:hypothetical protein
LIGDDLPDAYKECGELLALFSSIGQKIKL